VNEQIASFGFDRLQPKKAVRLWLFSIAVSFYTTFVLQSLWNWFVAPSLHVSEISYWQMFGLNLLVRVVVEKDTLLEDKRWDRALTLLQVCVPGEKRAAIEERIEVENEEVRFQLAAHVGARVVSSTVTLVIGWLVHTLAAA
jgi:hypothetical protein